MRSKILKLINLSYLFQQWEKSQRKRGRAGKQKTSRPDPKHGGGRRRRWPLRIPTTKHPRWRRRDVGRDMQCWGGRNVGQTQVSFNTSWNKTITDGGSTAPQKWSVIREDYLRTQRRFKRCKRDSRASIVGRRTSAFAPSARRLTFDTRLSTPDYPSYIS